MAGLTSVLAEVSPLSDEEEQAGDDYPLPPDHWLNSPLGRDGDYKTFLHLALETGNNDAGQDIFHRHEPQSSLHGKRCEVVIGAKLLTT